MFELYTVEIRFPMLELKIAGEPEIRSDDWLHRRDNRFLSAFMCDGSLNSDMMIGPCCEMVMKREPGEQHATMPCN